MNTMQVVYYGEQAPYQYTKSLFLAGPSLRSGQEGISWRKDALQILNDKGFDGVIFVPENREGRLDENHAYDQTVGWEEKHLSAADVVLFWVPCKMDTLPALTSRSEFSEYQSSGKIVFGAPEDAERVRNLHHRAKQHNIPTAQNLTLTIDNALAKIGEGAERSNAERDIPLHIWKTATFQKWYREELDRGNRLEAAKVLYSLQQPHHDHIFLWVLKPTLYIGNTGQLKDNEVIIGHTETSSIPLF